LKINKTTAANLETTMNKIIENEHLTIDEDAKKILLNISNNSIRILINHLEKIYILKQPVNAELVCKLCSNISYQQFDNYIDRLKGRDLNGAIQILYEIYEHGYSVIDILDYFFTYIKNTMKIKEAEKYKILPFLCKYITIFHKVHEDSIELAFFTNNLFTVISS
jgi:DNA polymerase III gamma/tau subunit